MSVDQRAKRRYCGYCGRVFEHMTFEEFDCHQSVCEREMVRAYRRNKDAGKTPYPKDDKEQMEGGCK